MSDYKEFQAKNLDAAIQDACTHFGTERVKLEIEILEDSKSGIFGLVGARKARVNARLVQLPDFSNPKVTLESKKTANKPKPPKSREKEIQPSAKPSVQPSAKPSVQPSAKPSVQPSAKPNAKPDLYDDEEGESQRAFLSKMHHVQEEVLEDHVLDDLDRKAAARANILGNVSASEITPARDNGQGRRNGHTNGHNKAKPNGRPQPRDRQDRPERDIKPVDLERQEISRMHKERRQVLAKERGPKVERDPSQIENETTAFPRVLLVELDQEKLLTVSRETLLHLIKGIVGEDAPMEVTIDDDRVRMTVESEDTGLLIGREGQHLAAIQYLAARIITRHMQSQVRVQLDTGDYHMRQDIRIHEIALSLAEKVKETGRSYSTRPLSAYQRRVVHLALQEDTAVQTRSSGDGSQKRVIIMRAKPQNNENKSAAMNTEESLGTPETQQNYEQAED